MIELDIQLVATVLSILVILFGAISVIYRFMFKTIKHYEPLPDKVESFQKSIDELTRRSENDFTMIQQQSFMLDIMLEALTAMMDHMITGNHQKQMEEVKTEMIRRMMVSRKDLGCYE